MSTDNQKIYLEYYYYSVPKKTKNITNNKTKVQKPRYCTSWTNKKIDNMSRVTKKRNLSVLHFLSAGVWTLMWYGVLQVVQWQNANPSWNIESQSRNQTSKRNPAYHMKFQSETSAIIAEIESFKHNIQNTQALRSSKINLHI